MESSINKSETVDQYGGLILDPSHELRFKGPFDDFVSVTLTIRNPTDKRIAFKIKTTAPKRYCVKPNSGVLDPSNTIKVNVLLQPFQYDPNEKNKHKFMVQYIYLSEEEMKMNVQDILNMWKDVAQERLYDIKLKCIFELNENDQQKASSPAVTAGVSPQPSTLGSQQSTSSFSIASVQSLSDDNSSKSSNLKTPQQFRTRESGTSNQNQNNSAKSLANEVTNADLSTTITSDAQNLNGKDRIDNLVNELKVTRNENEKLKKEIEKLKDEQTRLKKLALQDSSKSNQMLRNDHSQDQLINQLLNNKFIIVVVILVAIIFYLLIKK